MKSIILAAGEGTRLRPYTLSRPKCMVEVGGRSLLDRQLDILEAAGVEENIIVGGYLFDKLSKRGARYYENPDYHKTNMVWTLFCAEEELQGEIIISYGDIVYSLKNLRDLLECSSDIAVTIDLDWERYWHARLEDPLSDAETLKLTEKGTILEIGKKPGSLDEIEGQYMGLMKFSPKGTELLKTVFNELKDRGSIQGKPVEKAYMTDLLQEMIGLGYTLQSVPVRGGWIEVDTVNDLESDITRTRLDSIENNNLS